jgi:hypothetical protein
MPSPLRARGLPAAASGPFTDGKADSHPRWGARNLDAQRMLRLETARSPSGGLGLTRDVAEQAAAEHDASRLASHPYPGSQGRWLSAVGGATQAAGYGVDSARDGR